MAHAHGFGTGWAVKHLVAKRAPPWQPTVGQAVQVMRCEKPEDRQFIGKKGTVTRSRGFGLFEVVIEDERTVRLPSNCLAPVAE